MENTENVQNDQEKEGLELKPCHLKLYIAGASMNSIRSIQNIKNFCHQFLNNQVELEIIDIYQQPQLAEQEQIIALPLLVRKYPLPEKRFVGDLSDTQILLTGLEITNN